MFIHPGALRGFHVYGPTENWLPYVSQHLTFHQEYGNIHDQFAVVGKVDLHHRGSVIVGHVPREISRFIWYALQHGAFIAATVSDANPRRSPLAQGGLEIPLEWRISWTDFKKLEILRQKMLSVVFGDYADESSQILRDMGITEDGDGEEGDDGEESDGSDEDDQRAGGTDDDDDVDDSISENDDQMFSERDEDESDMYDTDARSDENDDNEAVSDGNNVDDDDEDDISPSRSKISRATRVIISDDSSDSGEDDNVVLCKRPRFG